MTLLSDLKSLGFIKDCTNFDALEKLLEEKQQTFYVGTDLTADSLHVGHLMPLMFMRKVLARGHRVIIVLGGGTTKIGDPSDKNEMRKMLSDEQIVENKLGIKKCLSQIFDRNLEAQQEGKFIDNLMIIDNANWLLNINYIWFLREIGTCFTINKMINMEIVRRRLDNNIPYTFFEFNYMLIQGYDFYYLNNNYGCNIQVGGSDQWGNIIQGCELIRRKAVDSRKVVTENEVNVFGITLNLLTKSDGTKMGKTAGGAVWLRRDKLSSYDYFQYFRDCADDDVIKLLKIFTDIPLEQIEKYAKLSGKELNAVKEVLAYEATKICRGEEEANKARNREVTEEITCRQGKNIVDVLVENGLCSSKSEARRLLDNRGVRFDGETVDKNFSVENEGELVVGKKRKFQISF
ncbi:MAG: tyrosine--tRNA ligase [Rickettsiales bacterium]|nr:tyrosine--tRNA ligase [Rickettsiales bacterium]